MPLTPHAIAGRIIALALFSCLLCIQVASGDEQKIEVIRNGVATTLVLPEYTSQGIPYASLADLTRQLGGSVEVDGVRAAVVLGEVRAEVGLNDVAVRRGTASFTLLHPVLPYQSDALIAMSDVVAFLRDAYGMGTPENPPADSSLALPAEEVPLESAAPTQPAPADAMEDAPLESVAPAALPLEEASLESVAPATPAPAPAPLPAGNITVAIDAGHGGDDVGVVGAAGLAEKDLTLAVANRLRQILSEQYGLTTVATREADELRTQPARADVLGSGKGQLMISIHAGASYATGAAGPALFAHMTSGAPGASLSIARTMAGALGAVSAPAVPVVHEVALGLLRDRREPGVMIELGNLANPTEETRLADPQYQEQLAAALAAGLNQALGRPAPAGAAQ